MNNKLLYRVLSVFIAYALLRFMGGSFGKIVLYPVQLLVTFLHEFGHAAGAILTGGRVVSLDVNTDGSGVTATQGGNIAIILMGGYLGSAIFGNILLNIGSRPNSRLSQITLVVLAAFMLLAGVVWFKDMTSTGLLVGFALILLFVAWKTTFDRDVVLFLGMATILYIIQDFNNGPSSDLAMYEERVGLLPAKVWMYVWLIIAALISIFNLRQIFIRKA